MLIKNLTKRERRIAVITISMVGAALIYNFILDPLISRWKALNSETESRVNALEKDAFILANQKTVESEYARYAMSAKSQKSVERMAADLLAFIENTARNDSCFIVNIKPVGSKDLGTHKELWIDITAEAGMDQFSKFLYDIENNRDLLLNIERFTLNSKSQSGVLRGSFIISKVILD